MNSETNNRKALSDDELEVVTGGMLVMVSNGSNFILKVMNSDGTVANTYTVLRGSNGLKKFLETNYWTDFEAGHRDEQAINYLLGKGIIG